MKLTFGVAAAVVGDLIKASGGRGDPPTRAQLAQAVGPVGGEPVGHDEGVADVARLQRPPHLRLGAVEQRRSLLACSISTEAVKADLESFMCA